jgi:hypothetical protein
LSLPGLVAKDDSEQETLAPDTSTAATVHEKPPLSLTGLVANDDSEQETLAPDTSTAATVHEKPPLSLPGLVANRLPFLYFSSLILNNHVSSRQPNFRMW